MDNFGTFDLFEKSLKQWPQHCQGLSVKALMSWPNNDMVFDTQTGTHRR